MHSPHRPSRWYRSRLARIVLSLGITLPLAFSALFMWAMWNPTATLKDLPVALVNLDQPAGEGPDAVRAGDRIVDNLLAGRALDWQLTSAAEAAEGLQVGDYYFVVEIPADFSATLAGIGTTATEQARINVTFNDNNTTMASAIGGRVMDALTAALLASTSSNAVDTVLAGVNELGSGLRDAADGAGLLADGTAQLADGIDQFTDGVVGEFAPGLSQAAAGSTEFADGVAEFAAGLAQFQAGTGELGAGAQQLSDGLGTLAGTVDPDGTLAPQARAVQAQFAARPDPASQQVADILDKAAQLLEGLAQLDAGGAELARQLTDPTADYRAGIDALAAGGAELATGADALSDGLGQLDSGFGQVVANLPRLQDGARQVDDGVRQLADGLAAGAGQAPDLGDDAVRADLAALVSTPIATESTNLASASVPGTSKLGPGAAPVLLAIAPALAAVLVTMFFRAHDRQTGAVPRPLLRTLAVFLISLATVGGLAATMWAALTPSPDPAHPVQAVAVVVVGTLMAAALTGAAFAVLGYTAGVLFSLAATMIQIFTFGGIWMIETVPAPLRALHGVAPMTHTRDGLIASFNGAPGLAPAITTMLALTVLGAVVQLLAHRRRRPAPAAAEVREFADAEVH